MEIWAGIHDALSARIAEQLSFDRLWLSSFCLSAARLGRPDDGSLGPPDVLAVLHDVSPVVTRPLIVDGENGYQLPRRQLLDLLRSYFDAGAGGVCIEDTLGDKQCSLWEGSDRSFRQIPEMQDLLVDLTALAAEYGGIVLARTESLIEGEGPARALERLSAYAETGVWGVVPHFRKQPEQSLEVADALRDRTRVMIIPTMAPDITVDRAESAGYSVYLAANVGVRAAAAAMRTALGEVVRSRRLDTTGPMCMGLNDFRQMLEEPVDSAA